MSVPVWKMLGMSAPPWMLPWDSPEVKEYWRRRNEKIAITRARNRPKKVAWGKILEETRRREAAMGLNNHLTGDTV